MPLASNGSEFNGAYGGLPPSSHQPEKKRSMHFSRASIKAQIDHLRTGLKGHRGSKDFFSLHDGCPDISPVYDSDIICISPLFHQENDALYNSTFLDDIPLEYNESNDQHVDAALASFSSDCEIGAVPVSGSVSTTTFYAPDVWRPTSATEEDSMLCSPLTAFSEDSSDAWGAFNTSPILTDDNYQPCETTSDGYLDDFQYPQQTPLSISIDEFGLSSSPRASFAAPHTSTGLNHRSSLPISYSGIVSSTMKSVSVFSVAASLRGLVYIEDERSQEEFNLKQEKKRQRRDSPYLGGFFFSDEKPNENTVDSFLNTHKSRRSCWECPCIPKIAKRQTKWSLSLGLTPSILENNLVEQLELELDLELDDLCRSATPSVASTDCVLGEPTPPLVIPAYRLSFEQLLDSRFNMDSVKVAGKSSDLTCDSSYSVLSANSSGSGSGLAPGRPTQDSRPAPRFFSIFGKWPRNREADVLSLDQNEYKKYILALPSPGPLIPVQQGEGLPLSDLPDLVISRPSPTVGLEPTQVGATRQFLSSRSYGSFNHDHFSLPDAVASGSVDGEPRPRAGSVLKHTSESTSKLKHFANRLFKRRTTNLTNHHLPGARQYSQIRGPLDDLLLDVEGGTDTGWLTLVQEDWDVLASSSSSRTDSSR